MDRIDKIEKSIIEVYIVLFIIILLVCVLLSINIESIDNKIEDLEERNTQVHEYILNKIGG